METDVGDNYELDLIDFASQDSLFMGRWILSNFTETVTANEEILDLTFNRYLPKW